MNSILRTFRAKMAKADPKYGAEDFYRMLALCEMKALYTGYGLCPACLPNGEVTDEEPETSSNGEHIHGTCSNCEDTAYGMNAEMADYLIHSALPAWANR